MLHAAKAMALTAIDIIEDPAHLQKIRESLRNASRDAVHLPNT